MTVTAPSVPATADAPLDLTQRKFYASHLHVVPDESTGDVRTFTVPTLPGLAPGLTMERLMVQMGALRTTLATAGLEPEGAPWMSLVSPDTSKLHVVLKGSVDARERLLHVVTALLRVWYDQSPEHFFRTSVPDTV